MPDGSIEYGEVSTEALRRELLEELNINIYRVMYLLFTRHVY